MPKRAINPIEEDLYPYAIVDSIIYFSTAGRDKRLPSSVHVVYRELCDATVEYISRRRERFQPERITVRRQEGEKVYWSPELGFEQRMWDYLHKNLKEHGNKLAPKVRSGIEEMLEPAFVSGQGDKGYNYLLLSHFDLDIVGVIARPTNLQLETKQWVQKVIPALTPKERRDVQGIGKAMRRYILMDELCW